MAVYSSLRRKPEPRSLTSLHQLVLPQSQWPAFNALVQLSLVFQTAQHLPKLGNNGSLGPTHQFHQALPLGVGGTGDGTPVVIAVALKNGELPARIACITNGTGSARDIKRRVGAFLPGNISAHKFLSCTARQLALGLLRVGGAEMLGLPPAFPVLQQDEVLELLCVLLGANRQNRRKIAAEATRVWAWHLRQRAGYPDELIPPEREGWLPTIARYEAEKQSHNAVDKSDVIPMAIQALESNSDFRHAAGRDRFKLLAVDDFQNMTPVEYRLLGLLTGPERLITIAVNSNEGLRLSEGTDNRLPGIFRLDHPKAQEFTLKANLRATQVLGQATTRIVDFPGLDHLHKEDSVFMRFRMRVGDQSFPCADPVLKTFEGRPVDMYRHILDGSEKFVEQGYELKDIAVIFLDEPTLDEMRPLALSRGMRYSVLRDKRRARDRDVRSIVGLLRCLLNPKDFDAFRSASCINPHLEDQWLDCNVAGSTWEMANREGISLAQAARRQSENPLVGVDARQGLRFFADAQGDLNRMIRDPSTRVRDLCRRAVALVEDVQVGVHALREKAQVGKLVHISDLSDLVSIGRHQKQGQNRLMQELETLCDSLDGEMGADPLAAENGDPFVGDPGITFTSVEASQGLEWRIVWVVGASDHILPGGISPEYVAQMREAQRRFYVAVTRARDHLIFCHPIRSGPTQDAKPSRFLLPIGDMLRHEVIAPPEPRR